MFILHPVNIGDNLIRRRSTDSSVTIPFERTFRNLETGQLGDEEQFNFCGCGWPQHMLVPKGLPGNGLQCDLFVMITDHNIDRVEQDLVGTCNDAASFCGVRDRRYPDTRAMGFPFDRNSSAGVDRLEQFLTPNMGVTSCTIQHTDETRARRT